MSRPKVMLLAAVPAFLVGVVITAVACALVDAFRSGAVSPTPEERTIDTEPWAPDVYTEVSGWYRVGFGEDGFTAEPAGSYAKIADSVGEMDRARR